MENATAACDESAEADSAPSRAYRLRADEDAAAGVRRVILGRLDKGDRAPA